MARKTPKNGETNQVEEEFKVAQQALENTKTPVKSWEERSNLERQESMNDYAQMIIASTIKSQKAFWDKSMNAKEIDNSMPYNASNGQTYGGVSSVLLRCVSAMEGYDNPAFLTMKQANLLGGKLKRDFDKETGELLTTKNGKDKYVRGVKVTMQKTYDFKPKLDEKGNPITREITDKEGNKTEVQVMEKYYLEKPVLETITLYHISQFNDLKLEKLKERDLQPLQEYRAKQVNKANDRRPAMEKLGLSPKTAQALNNFLTSQNKGIDYVKTQSLNQTLKEERQQQNQIQSGRSM